MGPAQSCPDLTPSRDPKKYPKIIFINETQFEAKSAKKLNMQENHTLINLKENIRQSKLGIRKNGNVPKTP